MYGLKKKNQMFMMAMRMNDGILMIKLILVTRSQKFTPLVQDPKGRPGCE